MMRSLKCKSVRKNSGQPLRRSCGTKEAWASVVGMMVLANNFVISVLLSFVKCKHVCKTKSYSMICGKIGSAVL